MKKLHLQILVYLSSVLALVGMFIPLGKIPLVGEITYFRVFGNQAWFMLGFLLLAPLCAFLNKKWLLSGSVAGLWCAFFWPAIRSVIEPKDESFLGSIVDDVIRKNMDPLQRYASEIFEHISLAPDELMFPLSALVLTLVTFIFLLKK